MKLFLELFEETLVIEILDAIRPRDIPILETMISHSFLRKVPLICVDLTQAKYGHEMLEPLKKIKSMTVTSPLDPELPKVHAKVCIIDTKKELSHQHSLAAALSFLKSPHEEKILQYRALQKERSILQTQKHFLELAQGSQAEVKIATLKGHYDTIVQAERKKLQILEDFIHHWLIQKNTPGLESVLDTRFASYKNEIQRMLQDGGLTEWNSPESFAPMAVSFTIPKIERMRKVTLDPQIHKLTQEIAELTKAIATLEPTPIPPELIHNFHESDRLKSENAQLVKDCMEKGLEFNRKELLRWIPIYADLFRWDDPAVQERRKAAAAAAAKKAA